MLNNVKPEVHIEVSMALAPIPADPDRRERNEDKITTAAKAAMAGCAPLKGPLAINLSMTYAPTASMRRGHTWRVTAPTCWDLARFILPLLQGICFVSAGQIAKLEVTKSYAPKARTVITIKQLGA